MVLCEDKVGRGILEVWGDTFRGEIILAVVFESGDILYFRDGVYALCPERVDDFFLIERGSILLNGVGVPLTGLGVLSPSPEGVKRLSFTSGKWRWRFIVICRLVRMLEFLRLRNHLSIHGRKLPRRSSRWTSWR
jgi:hypothetical protein